MRELTGTTVAKWLDVQLPKVQNLRLDLLGETLHGGLIHLELQSSNDAAMPFRMVEYCLGVHRLFGQFPRQILLYVGEAPILAQLRDHKEAVHKIVERIAGLAKAARETALAQLTILAGLRHLSKAVEQETRKMPIDLDIREHEVLGPIIIEAEQKGRQEGLQAGLQAGELTILRRQIEKRFGALTGWAVEKLSALSSSDLEDLSERVLDAKSVEELLR